MGILYIEDDYIIRTEIKEHLLKTGKNVFAVRNCEEARKIFYNNKINLLITDIKLPDGDGLRLAHEFRNIKSDLRVIVLTAFEAYFFNLKELTTDAFMVKPVYREQFLNKIMELYKDA